LIRLHQLGYWQSQALLQRVARALAVPVGHLLRAMVMSHIPAAAEGAGVLTREVAAAVPRRKIRVAAMGLRRYQCMQADPAETPERVAGLEHLGQHQIVQASHPQTTKKAPAGQVGRVITRLPRMDTPVPLAVAVAETTTE
jgi:hypothetical protein